MQHKLKKIENKLMVEVPKGIVADMGLNERDILHFPMHNDSMLVAKEGGEGYER